MLVASNAAKFEELFEPSWALDHVVYDGELLQLKLDNFSGNNFKQTLSIASHCI